MENNVMNTINKIDTAFLFIFGVSIVILVLITLVTIYFLYKYHRTRNPEPADIEGNILAETLWTVIPTLIVLAMFWFGWTGYKALRDVPDNAMEVKVTARMWSWKFEYPNGKTSDKLYVPENTPVKLDMTSTDVIHSFYVPAFRIKMDTVPGMQTYVWFDSDKPATYDILCAEYCGVRHAYMLSKVIVMPEQEYEQWVSASDDAGGDASEEMAILENHGCLDCHSMDGSELVGPTLKDIYDRETVVVLEDGSEKKLKADEAYLEKAIYDPSSEIVKGYEDMMPPYNEDMPQEELDKLVAFLKNGMKSEKLGAKGEMIAENEGCLGCHSTDGSEIVGPSFKNMLGRKLTAIKDGKKVDLVANTQYIINSIKSPQEYLVDGYDDSMPPYDHLGDDEIKSLMEYFSTLKD